MSTPDYTSLLIENARLKSKIAELQRAGQSQEEVTSKSHFPSNIASPFSSAGLSNTSIFRYSRQLLVPEFGSPPSYSQRALLDASVLVIGAGGLGCPVVLYLAAAGIGRIGIVDQDVIDESNLHRQICHGNDSIGKSKAQSAALAAKRLNPNCKLDVHNVSFEPSNAASLLLDYDVLIDCSDNVATRYLCNDVAVLTGKPLVSGSALRMEGQLTVYGFDGPCYRCLFPRAPPANTVTNCSDGGVVGPITGVIGTMQAMEVIKVIILSASHRSSELQAPDLQTLNGRLILYDGATAQIRTVKLRGKSSDCAVCSDKRTITLEQITNGMEDYLQQCGTLFHDRPAQMNTDTPQFMKVNHMNVKEFKSKLDAIMSIQPAQSPLIIDVRSEVQFDICHLPQSINIPLKELQDANDLSYMLKTRIAAVHDLDKGSSDKITECFVVCRRGLDSIAATSILAQQPNWKVNNVSGGLGAWSREIDSTFPIY